MKYRPLYFEKAVGGPGGTAYTWVEDALGQLRRAIPTDTPGLRVLRMDNLTSQAQGRAKGEGAASWFPVDLDGRTYRPTMNSRWKTNEVGMGRLKISRRIYPVGNTLSYVRYLNDFPVFPINNQWTDTGVSGYADPRVYVVQTTPRVVERCLLMTSDPGDLILDPTCGSGTTAFMAEQWGRRWITIDTS